MSTIDREISGKIMSVLLPEADLCGAPTHFRTQENAAFT
jgi:hypothetical protein